MQVVLRVVWVDRKALTFFGPLSQAFALKLFEVLKTVEKPVICIEKPYLEGFVEGVQEMPSSFPFVLLVVNGGDAPLTEDLQSQCLDDIWCFACLWCEAVKRELMTEICKMPVCMDALLISQDSTSRRPTGMLCQQSAQDKAHGCFPSSSPRLGMTRCGIWHGIWLGDVGEMGWNTCHEVLGQVPQCETSCI